MQVLAGWVMAAVLFAVESPAPPVPALDPPTSSVLTDAASFSIPSPPPPPMHAASWRRGMVALGYAGLYGGATRVGSRLGLESRFEIVRLESAYAYDLVSHVYNVQQIGGLMANLHQQAGTEPARARSWGAWLGAFGSLTYMEVINGFMPGVRFDPLDPLANALGAWLATGGRDLALRHAWLRRFTLEFGYKSLRRAVGPARSSGWLGNWWHDYPNGRFGLGCAVGPLDAPWLRVFASYEITSLQLEELRNRFGLGIEIPAGTWLGPWLARVPGGRAVRGAYEWLDRRLLMPGLYVQLWSFEAGPFSDREPFQP